jgi:NAD(P)-dependent dehydrogenase (short-subunit alcohol dehydrogenase family)
MSLLARTVVCITNPRGLGLLLARRFAQDCARIVLAGPDIDELEQAHRDLSRRGADVLAYPCDPADEESVRELLNMAVLWFGRVDVLVKISPNGTGRAIVDVVHQPVAHNEN